MCYTYDEASMAELGGEHTLTGLEKGDGNTIWWLPRKQTYLMFTLDAQTYMAVGDERRLDAIYIVDDNRQPEQSFAPIPVNVTEDGGVLTITPDGGDEPIVRVGTTKDGLVMEADFGRTMDAGTISVSEKPKALAAV